MKKFIIFIGLFFTSTAQAVCPVCTVAVGAGVGVFQWMGIDDTIAGLWIGALLMSVTMWTINWLDRKKVRFIGRKPLILAAYYGLAIIPLYNNGMMGNTFNTLWGVDKLLLGIIVGSVVFLGAELWYNQMKKKNDGKAYFPLQKVAMPLIALLVLSAAFFFITK